jgi:hypothetical protein
MFANFMYLLYYPRFASVLLRNEWFVATHASNRQDASNSMYYKDASNNTDCMDVSNGGVARKSVDASNSMYGRDAR